MTTDAKGKLKIERRNVRVSYRPRYWALEMHNSKDMVEKKIRWWVLVIHRRGGKTTAALNHLQRDAMRYPNTRYAYIAPTYKQAKRIVWKMAIEYASGIVGVKFNVSELLITYPNGSEIMILGADDPDSLRGIALWGCFLDEYPQMSPIVFTEVITKCLADHLGYCIFGGTPKGKGHFYKVYKVARDNPTEWGLVYRTVDQSLELEGGETIQNLRRAIEDDKALVRQGLMTEEEFQQEWFNSFEAAIRGAVYLEQVAAARVGKHPRLGFYPHDPSELVYTVWDLGISKSDAMAVGFYQVIGGAVRMIDYLETLQKGFPVTIKLVKDKPYIYGRHFAPHDIRNKELGTGKSRLEAALKLGIDFEVVPSLSLEDGIDLGRAFWSKLQVDGEHCELWLDFIGQYRYEFDIAQGQFTKRPVHDFTSHAADVHRYAAICEEYMVPQDQAIDTGSRRGSTPEERDEFMGDLDWEEPEERIGMGKHPIMKGVNIGALGHKPPPAQ